MTDNLQASFERCCRLCAEEQDVTIMIFSQEAESMLLQNKLNKYLLIEVEEDDKLPKNICIQCCTKLQTVCDFIDKTRRAQDVLLNRSLIFDELMTGKDMLTTSIKQEIEFEPEEPQNDETKYTEMEISVDPMVVLQNSEETHNNDISISVEDVTYLHADAIDAENVTIKLIKKTERIDRVESVERVEQVERLEKVDKVRQQETDEDTQNNSSKPFSCLTCKRSFFTELALKNHSWQHINEEDSGEKYTCGTCMAPFQYKNELVAHLRQHRTNGLCQLCGRMFRSEKNYVAHMSVHSPLNRSYTCKICGRSYNTWGGLKTHSIAHSSERPYTCHYCKKTFKRNQDLKFHINQHTGDKPYKCPFCEKSFASSGNCYSHRSRMHPGKRVEGRVKKWNIIAKESPPLRPIAPKPAPRPTTPKLTVIKGIYKYQCQLCKSSFVKRDNFTYHMYQHTGEKPFQCSFCPEKFVTRRGLLLHHDKFHPASKRPLALISKNVLLK